MLGLVELAFACPISVAPKPPTNQYTTFEVEVFTNRIFTIRILLHFTTKNGLPVFQCANRDLGKFNIQGRTIIQYRNAQPDCSKVQAFNSSIFVYIAAGARR